MKHINQVAILAGGGVFFLLDDYCYSNKYVLTNKLFNDYEINKSVKVLQLPTEQWIIIK